MEYLGYNRRKNAAYEGEPSNGYRVMPPPQIFPIRFTTEGSIPEIVRVHDELPQLLFREDDFDPVTKIRRGRVFKASEEIQPKVWHVTDSLYSQRRQPFHVLENHQHRMQSGWNAGLINQSNTDVQ